MRGSLVLSLVVSALSLAACSSKGGGDGASIMPDPNAPDGGAVTQGPDAKTNKAKAGAVSGSRLKSRWLSGEDGSKLAAGMRDSQREEDCAFQRASDGVMRCLPASVAWSNAWYAESTCTQLLAYAAKGCTPPVYASETITASTGCTSGAGVRIRQIKARYTGTSFYTKGANGACTASPATGLTASYDLYTIGAEVPPADFVGATETFE